MFPPPPATLVARGVAVRKAAAKDAEFQRGLYIANRQAQMAATGWPRPLIETFLADQFCLQTLHYDKTYPRAARLIVELAKRPVGRLIVNDDRRELRIVDIALHPDYHDQGMGGALVAWVQEAARLGKRNKVTLAVEATNPARRLYEKLGFHCVAGDGVYWSMEWLTTASVR